MAFCCYLHHQFFNQQRFRADGILFPNLHKALFVGRNFMRTVSLIILTFNFFALQAQVTDKKPLSSDSVKVFKNQGEQEDFFAGQFFKNNYSKQKFDRYGEDIIISGDSVKYLDKYFLVQTPDKFKLIFSTGIFYPTIIAGLSKRDYRFTIFNFEELTFLNYSVTRKRFRFWLYRNTLLNPTVCFIELTNQNATDKTDIETFIKGASLTFYSEGWIII